MNSEIFTNAELRYILDLLNEALMEIPEHGEFSESSRAICNEIKEKVEALLETGRRRVEQFMNQSF